MYADFPKLAEKLSVIRTDRHENLVRPDFPKTVDPSVLTYRNAVGPTISKYISDRMSGKT
jgi:hypothetical protein